jgi:RHS repeat-associated protein
MRTHLSLPCAMLLLASAHAQTLPPPPASLAPIVKYEYDAVGNPKRTILAPAVANHTTTSTFDRLNRRQDITDAKTGVTKFGYNGREDLIQVTDPRLLTTNTPRNGLGDVTGVTSPDTGAANHVLDAAGNLLKRTDSRGVAADQTYDALNRPLSLVYSAPTSRDRAIYGWTYDETDAGTSYGVGRLTTSRFPSGNTRFAYDPQGRVTGVSQQVSPYGERAPFGHAVRYDYDAAGHVISITYPSGRVLLVGYSGGLPSTMSLAPSASSAAQAVISQLQFEPFGAAQSWLWHMASGTQAHQRVFDTSGRMVRYPLATVVRDISYDAVDRISSYSHLDRNTGLQTAGAMALNQVFGYDELGRLTSVDSGSGAQMAQWVYSYDANGNRSGGSFRGNTGSSFQTRAYDVATTSNRLLGLSNPTRALGYDAAGNVLQDQQALPALPGSNPTSWNATIGLDGRITSLRTTPYATGATTVTTTTYYLHNASGQRVLKQTLAVQTCTSPNVCTNVPPPRNGTFYVYGLEGELLGEYDLANGGQALREYIWLQGMPVAVVINDSSNPSPSITQMFYIHADHLNTPRVVVNRAGAMRWSWMAEPFGSNSESNNPQGLGVFGFNLRMPGQYFDAESGLNYNYFRSYDSGVGRYTQSDPIGLEGGINTYSYAESQPTSLFDPTGLATYMCTQPLHALGKVGEWVYAPKSNKLHHKFIGVVRPDGSTVTGGQDRAGKPWSDGTPSEGDGAHGNHECEKVEDDNECLEQCLLPKMRSTERPKYALIPGTINGGENCQSWAEKTVDECRKQCKARR